MNSAIGHIGIGRAGVPNMRAGWARRVAVLAALLAGLIAVGALGLGGASQAYAQASGTQAGTDAQKPTAKPATTLSTKELDDLVKTLEDKDKRDAFVKTLKGLLEARRAAEAGKKEPQASGLVATLSARASKAADGLFAAASALLDVSRIWTWIDTQVQDPLKRDKWISGIWKTLLVIALAMLVEFLLRLLLRRPRAAVEAKDSDAWPVRLLFLSARTVLDLLPIGAFAATAYGVLPLLEPTDAVRLIALTIIYANVLARAILAIARMILVPKAETLRLVPLSTEDARYLYLWVRRFANTGIYVYFAIQAAALFGLPADVAEALTRVLGLVLAIMTIVFVLQNRKTVGDWIHDGSEDAKARGFSGIRARVADVWHILAVIYVVAVFLVWVLEVEGGFIFLMRASALTLLIGGVSLLAARGSSRLLNRMFRVEAELETGAPGLEMRANRYLPFLRRGVRLLIYAFAALIVVEVWGADILRWFGTDPGQRFLGGVATVVLVLIGALIIWELISGAIERYLERLQDSSIDRDRAKRLGTLLPLARNAILVAMVVFVSLIVLSELGVNIGPLLAGAGVVGLAIGFGAQTLVKDVITGLFILLEDTIQVGDVVEADGRSGVVEGLSIRTIRIRDLHGSLHTVPFSSVASVKNMTKDFAYYLFEVGVAYREDTDEVIAILRELDEALRADDTYGDMILAPLDVWGVDRFDDSAVVIRARYKTKPGNQWAVGRAFNGRMKKAFDERGIEIPFPHITLYAGEGKDGTAPPMPVRHQEGLPRPKRGKAASAKDEQAKAEAGEIDESGSARERHGE